MDKEVIFILGDGRSGTTWLTNIINSDLYYREIYEPFHPIYGTAELSKFGSKIISPNKVEIKKIQKLFEGNVENPRKDMSPMSDPFTNNLLIKDIHCYLNLGWIYEHFSKIKPIIIIRNPFATAFSKQNTQSWDWENELSILLETEVQSTFFSNHQEIIRKYSENDDYLIQQVLIWCMKYHVLFTSLDNKAYHIVRYEKLCQNFEKEFSSIKAYVGNKNIQGKNRYSPSIVTNKQEKDFKKNIQLDEWKKHISKKQLDIGKDIISSFKLENFI